MNVKLNGKITQEQLEAQTKETLVAVLATQPDCTAARGDLKRMTKAALVGTLMHLVQRQRESEDLAAADAEKARQATLAEERAAGRVKNLLGNLQASFEKQTCEAEGVRDEFRAEAVKNAGYAIVWLGEKVLEAEAMLREMCDGLKYTGEQFAEQTDTAEQMLGRFGEVREELERRVHEDGYRHNSTSSLDNVKNMAEFRAVQMAAAFHRNVCKIFAEVLSGKREPDEARYISPRYR